MEGAPSDHWLTFYHQNLASDASGRGSSGLVVKYKTELCRNWVQGYCAYGVNCMFAHGNYEKRPKCVPENYKTKLCLNLLRDGYCKYGTRCLFRHRDGDPCHEPDSVTRDNSAELTGRLPIFVDIVKRHV